MRLFHDEEETQGGEPIPGLPERLPDGESILWQGKPAFRPFLIDAFHVRLVALYIAAVFAWRTIGALNGEAPLEALATTAVTTIAAAAAGFAILAALAAVMSRATIYTITNKRIVLRYGAALRKYVNIPFSQITAVALRRHENARKEGPGDIALSIAPSRKLGYLRLWPHARRFRIYNPQPSLRSLPNAQNVAEILAQAMKEAAPENVSVASGIDAVDGEDRASGQSLDLGAGGPRQPATA